MWGSVVRDQLRDVRDILGNGSAFAAILGNGSVIAYIAWGNPERSGDSSAVQDQFAAL